MVRTTRKENLDKYCDYHGIKGQRGNNIGRQQGNNNTNGKIINMIRVRGEDLKRKYQRNKEEDWMKMPITFPLIPADDLLDEPLIIEAEVEGYLVRRVFVDHGIAVQVMFKHFFDNLPLSFRARLTQTQTKLVGFSGEQLILMGKIKLNVAFRSEGLCKRTMMKFTMVRESSPYNIILRHTEKGPEKETVKNEKEYAEEEVLVNPAFPEQKDYYPLPKIDLKIEAVMGLPFKCFLDAYKGYHQIQMSKEDEEKTTFYIDQGTYHYTKMPFRLKNAGATYQRLVDSLFQAQLGWNLEAYVGDIENKRLSGTSVGRSTKLREIMPNYHYACYTYLGGCVGTKHLEICSLANEGNLEEWTLYTDGASSLKGMGAGLVLVDPTGTKYTYAIRLNFPSTNNEAKYDALLAGLRIA
nr:reverse transcriptase domain-containing protein [Tanacetum cinerariifolium]